MGKLQKHNNLPLAIALVVILASGLGATFWLATQRGWLGILRGENSEVLSSQRQQEEDANSQVLPLATLSPEQRETELKSIAEGKKSLDQYRARYLLAADLIATEQGEEALKWLDGLAKSYPLLAPQIALQQAGAYELTGDLEQEKEVLNQLLIDYPQEPVIVKALYDLGKTDAQYWDQAIAKFPYHPLTAQMIRERLEKNPDQFELVLWLVEYAPNSPDLLAKLEKEITNPPTQLSSENWQAIADFYWQNDLYAQAIPAYQKNPPTSPNLYRIARGLHLTGKTEAAKGNYQEFLKQFPDTEEASLALKHLASLSDSKDTIKYYDQAIATFPDAAPEVLMKKANLLDKMRSKTSASQVRQFLLDKYPESDTTADYRWQVAKKLAKEGELEKASTWAEKIIENNPQSEVTPKAAFWVGKWQQQLGQTQEAEKTFRYILATHPHSYYAWRSASILGMDVGDFANVRQLNPEVVEPQIRFAPPAGSEQFQELYQLGQDDQAQMLWEGEVGGKEELTVNEEFTDGLLMLNQQEYIQGIGKIWSLKLRSEPEEKAEWAVLRQRPDYWQALFPFPYQDVILQGSKQRQLNPLLVTSLIRQESRFEKEIVSSAGAVGLMQVLPSTGEWAAEKINLEDYSLTDPNDNVTLGTWFFNYTHQEYENNSLLAIASYNAGPGNVSKWVKEYGWEDPDVFIENIPFPETKGYVESVFGNYWNYLLIYNPEVRELGIGDK